MTGSIAAIELLLSSGGNPSLQSSLTFGYTLTGALVGPSELSSSLSDGWTLSATLTSPAELSSGTSLGVDLTGALTAPASLLAAYEYGWIASGTPGIAYRILSASLAVCPDVSGSVAVPVPQVGSLSVIVGDYQEALEIASDLAGGLLVCSEVQSSL